jgi:hypothetical protein
VVLGTGRDRQGRRRVGPRAPLNLASLGGNRTGRDPSIPGRPSRPRGAVPGPRKCLGSTGRRAERRAGVGSLASSGRIPGRPASGRGSIANWPGVSWGRVQPSAAASKLIEPRPTSEAVRSSPTLATAPRSACLSHKIRSRRPCPLGRPTRGGRPLRLSRPQDTGARDTSGGPPSFVSRVPRTPGPRTLRAGRPLSSLASPGRRGARTRSRGPRETAVRPSDGQKRDRGGASVAPELGPRSDRPPPHSWAPVPPRSPRPPLVLGGGRAGVGDPLRPPLFQRAPTRAPWRACPSITERKSRPRAC